MRKLRGALVLALLWGVAWSPIGLLMGIQNIRQRGPWDHLGFSPPPGFYARSLLFYAGSWALVGAITGTFFAAIIAFAEARRAFDDLSWKRFALFGALATMVLPVALLVIAVSTWGPSELSMDLLPLLSLGLLGALSAGLTLALARRGSSRGKVAA